MLGTINRRVNGVKTKMLAALAILAMILPATAGTSLVASETGVTALAGVIGGAIVILVVSALMPTIANSTAVAVASNDTDTKTDSMLELLPFGLGLGAFIGLFSWLL